MRGTERLRLILPLVLVVVLATALAAVVLIAVRNATSQVAQPRTAERVRFTTAAAEATGAWFDQAASEVRRTAGRLEPYVADDTATTEAILTAAQRRTVTVTDLFVVDPGGTVRATSDSASAWLGLRRDGPWLDRALAAGTAISEVIVDPLTRRPVLYVAAATHAAGGGAAAAVVAVATLDSGTLIDRLATLPVPAEGEIALVAPDGTIVRPTGVAGIERAGPDLAAPASLGRSAEGFIEYEGEAGIARIGAYAPAWEGGWVLVATQPAAAFTPLAEGTRALAAAAPGVIALVALLILVALVLDRRARHAEAEAEAAKRAFLAVSGHELRTPITVITGMVQTMLQRGDALDAAFRQRALSTMSIHARRLQLNIERILFVAHLRSGAGISVTTRDIEYATIVRRVVEHEQVLSPVHDFMLDVPDGPARIEGDAQALEQVLVQLLDNAVRYSPAETPIHVRTERHGRWVRFVVEDGGVGLPTDVDHLFEAFTQGEAVDTRLHDEGGVGLGLHIVKTLTEAMGGRVKLERLDPGTRAVVELRSAG